MHSGFILQQSDFKHICNGSTMIQYGLRGTCFRLGSSLVLQLIFGIYLESYLQYKNQNFVIMCGEDDGKSFSFVCKFLLPFQLRTASSSAECGNEEEFVYVHFMEVTKQI